jgi:Uma2 family endonuclease
MTTEVLKEETLDRITRYKATIEEFWALPESLQHIEYINGEIIMAPTPTVTHQAILRNLSFALHEFVKRAAAGSIFFSPLDVVLPSGDVVQPDAFFLTNEEMEQVRGAKRVHGAPSLAVEILSPGSIKHDTLTKRNLYEQNRVREYWIVDPEAKTIAQMILKENRYKLIELSEGDIIKSAVLEGFEMRVGVLTSDR